MKKSFFAGLGISLLAVIVLAVAGYAAFMTGGTRLLYENSVWGAYWRYYPWAFLAGGVLLVPGLICLKAGYVPKAKRPRKVKTVVRYAASQIRRTRRFAASAAPDWKPVIRPCKNNKEGRLAKRRVQRLPDRLKRARATVLSLFLTIGPT